jgi:peptide-methionine (S)-S-oxide reductase
MTRRALVVASLLLAAAVVVAGGQGVLSIRKEPTRILPPPAVDAKPSEAATEVAVLAGGCFWGMQGIYQHTKGVVSAVSGYAGGERRTAEYDLVGTGRTGHAESVQVTFDPRQISYGQLLQIFFSVAHDPTQLNHQGPDEGPQYRSAIFPMNAPQASIARAYIDQLGQARAFAADIVTTIETDRTFYPAENYHQDYVTRHPRQPYVVINDLPKIEHFKQAFPERYRPDPVLVLAKR